MRNGIYTALALVALIPAQPGSAVARELSVDGCTELTRTIYAEVAAALRHGPGRAGPWHIDQGQGDVLFCDHVAASVSRAFGLAMLSVGIQVSWGGQAASAHASDHCPHRLLSQCNPDVHAQLVAADAATNALVQESWTIVARSVMREMYNPFSSDEVSFRGNDLKLKLGLLLRSIDRSGLRPQAPSGVAGLPGGDNAARFLSVAGSNNNPDIAHRCEFADTPLQVFAFDACIDAGLL